MSTSLAHKIALGPTLEQRQFFEQAAGVSRFTYNWARAEWQERYQLGGKPKGNAEYPRLKKKGRSCAAKTKPSASRISM